MFTRFIRAYASNLSFALFWPFLCSSLGFPGFLTLFIDTLYCNVTFFVLSQKTCFNRHKTKKGLRANLFCLSLSIEINQKLILVFKEEKRQRQMFRYGTTVIANNFDFLACPSLGYKNNLWQSALAQRLDFCVRGGYIIFI